ncbi:hypothetical protein GGQ99_001295 [Aminobacter niigataensis]|uniref:Putative DnaT-like domain-containing protein n=1 Tax=Aminobacter niigataensis TaxID=83265 RepID=A0ABR6KYT3_9HYPH|nr:DnaT-like ssDNA-binding protein [Aminobacter niigataensis]MBB4649573.1 hypothetical protein [Aminobacter niigataensis]
MPLIVETGSGSPTAESYVSVADAAAYATARGLTFPTTPEAAAEQALRRATTWLDGRYRGSFPGSRTNRREQALEWPRINAYDRSCPPEYIDKNEIPVEIVNATIEAAVRELAAPGSLSPDVTPGKIKKSAKVGEIAVEYAVGSGVTDQRPVLTVIDDVLSSILSISRSPALFGKVLRA